MIALGGGQQQHSARTSMLIIKYILLNRTNYYLYITIIMRGQTYATVSVEKFFKI